MGHLQRKVGFQKPTKQNLINLLHKYSQATLHYVVVEVVRTLRYALILRAPFATDFARSDFAKADWAEDDG